MNNSLQAAYFNDSDHRHPTDTIISPTLSQRLELNALEMALGKPAGTQLIDFGCGSGRVAMYFLQRGYDVRGVDVSQTSLDDLTVLISKKKKPGWGVFTSSTQLPAEAFADGMVGADILHHVSLPLLLPKMYQALKPNGRVAFSEPNAWHLPWYIHYYKERIPWNVERGIMQCTNMNIRRQFLRNKFHTVQLKGHGLFPTPLFNQFPKLCQTNAIIWGNIPILNYFAFRYIVNASK